MTIKRIDKPEEYRVHKFDGVEASGVYGGMMTCLYSVRDKLKWKKERHKDIEYEWLTLKEIQEQLPKEPLLTVIIDDPLHGLILRYGNYNDGKWYRIGETCGYW